MSKSGSMRILDYFNKMDSNTEFTASDIHKSVPNISSGAVTGYIAKGVKAGGIELIGSKRILGIKNLVNIYKIKDIDILYKRTRNTQSIGSLPGRELSPFHMTKGKEIIDEPKAKTISDILKEFGDNIEESMNICLKTFKTAARVHANIAADEIGKMSDINNLSDDDLTAEIRKRLHNKDNKV